MCGIAGLFSFEGFKDKEDIREKTKALLLDIEARGTDATGISFINTKNNNVYIYKKNIKAREFIKEKDFNELFLLLQDYNLILLHTRNATTGDAKKNYNNHPFYNKLHNNVLIHNGTLNNYEDLIKEYKLKNIGDCDSEVILSLFNHFKKDGKTNIKKTLKQLKGFFAIGLYDSKKLYLYKDSNPLYLCYNKTEKLFLFSSYENIFKDMFTTSKRRKIYGIFENTTPNEEFFIKEFDNEDLIIIDFKKKTLNASICETKPYNYDYNPINQIKETIITTPNTTEEEKEILKDLNEEEDFKKIKENIIREENEKYLKSLEDYKKGREEELNYYDYS